MGHRGVRGIGGSSRTISDWGNKETFGEWYDCVMHGNFPLRRPLTHLGLLGFTYSFGLRASFYIVLNLRRLKGECFLVNVHGVVICVRDILFTGICNSGGM